MIRKVRELPLLRFDFEKVSSANSTRNSGGCLVASSVYEFAYAIASTFFRHSFEKVRRGGMAFVQFWVDSIITRQSFAKGRVLQYSQLIRGQLQNSAIQICARVFLLSRESSTR